MNVSLLRPVALLLVGAACALPVVSCSSDSSETSTGMTPNTQITTSFELRTNMHKLWTDHVTWTRVFIIDTLAGLPDTPQATTRLLQNQTDLGNAIKPFYGDAAGDQLTALLKTHITGAAAVVTAAKSGDMTALAAANKAWYANADQIAEFLAMANPDLDVADVKAMMKEHLDQTVAEVTARLQGDWNGDVKAYDAIVNHIIMMADAFTDGITAQFPNLVGPDTSMSAGDQNLHVAMRELWEDHVTWTRVVIIDAVAGLPDTDTAVARLMQNQVDLGNAIKPFYGDAAGDQLTTLLKQHISLAIEIVSEAKAGETNANKSSRGTPTEQWYANADAIAEFLAKANPNFNVDDLKAMMKRHLDLTLAEATARLTGDWASDVKDYDAVVEEILTMSDGLSDGVAEQFPDKLGS